MSVIASGYSRAMEKREEQEPAEKRFVLSSELRYLEGTDRIRLPRWARWLVELGKWIGTVGGREQLVRVAVSVPHRGFAAVLAALGVVAGAYRSGLPPSPADRLRFFSSLTPGTPVRYRSGDTTGKYDCAEFTIVELVAGTPHIRLSGRNLNYIREVSRFRYVQPLPPDVDPPAYSREICEAPDFVASATGLDPIEHGFPARLECVMIGTKAALEDELRIELAVGGEVGRLQDIVRCSELLNPADGYRSRTVSAYSEPDRAQIGCPVGGTILDGPSAILRHRHLASDVPWIALIDRTHPRAVDARDAVMADRASSLEDVVLPFGDPPTGVEALGFVDDRP